MTDANVVDPVSIANQMLIYAQHGNWRMLFAVALTLVVWFLRVVAIRPKMLEWRRFGYIIKFFRTDRGGIALTLGAGLLAGIVTTLKAGVPINGQLFMTCLVNGLISTGFFVALKKFAPERMPWHPKLPTRPHLRSVKKPAPRKPRR